MASLIKRHAGAFQLVFVVAVVGSAVMLSASLKPDERDIRPRSVSEQVEVTVVQPVQTAFSPLVELNGVVEARTITSIIPQVEGRVIEVAPGFRPGAVVAKGDVLFRIDPADYELAVERTLADIEVARSELAQLEAEAAAEREIWQSTSPDRPIPDLRARVPQIAAAEARLHSGQAARATAELALSRTVIRAPFDARILDTQLDVGQVVGMGSSVGSMFSEASLEIAVPVSSDEMQRIGSISGRTASITTPNGEEITGTVARKAAALDERTRLGTLFVVTDNSDALTVGEFVSITIEGAATADAVMLPPAALTARDRLWVVDGETLADRKIELLGRDGDAVIVSNFDTADGVVAIPPPDARIGLPVRRINGAAVASAGAVTGAANAAAGGVVGASK